MKMKSLVSFFLALLIFGTRVGYALNVHYCGDRIAEISLAYTTENCGMESDKEDTDPLKTGFSKPKSGFLIDAPGVLSPCPLEVSPSLYLSRTYSLCRLSSTYSMTFARVVP